MSASFATRGLLLTEHEFSVPLDHALPGRRADHRLRARGRRLRRARPADARLPAGRAGQRGAAPHPLSELAGLAGPRAARVPRAHARPARHRALEPDRLAARTERARAGRAPDALPRRRDRPRRRAHPRRAGDRAVEPAGPELRRAVRDELPVDRARGPARGAGDRAAWRLSGRGSTTSTARRTRARSSAAGATTSATPTTATASSRCASTWRPRTSACRRATG